MFCSTVVPIPVRALPFVPIGGMVRCAKFSMGVGCRVLIGEDCSQGTKQNLEVQETRLVHFQRLNRSIATLKVLCFPRKDVGEAGRLTVQCVLGTSEVSLTNEDGSD